jgi:hypothetical protein
MRRFPRRGGGKPAFTDSSPGYPVLMVHATERLGAGYAGEDTPLAGYGALVAGFGTLVGSVVVAAGRRGRLPERIPLYDLALAGIATQRLARLIAKDRVGAVVRAPFTRYQGRGRPGEIEEAPRRSGAGLAIGQLLVCPFCLAQWVALGMVGGLLFAPRVTRTASAVLTVGTLADLLQEAYVRAVPGPEGSG